MRGPANSLKNDVEVLLYLCYPSEHLNKVQSKKKTAEQALTHHMLGRRSLNQTTWCVCSRNWNTSGSNWAEDGIMNEYFMSSDVILALHTTNRQHCPSSFVAHEHSLHSPHHSTSTCVQMSSVRTYVGMCLSSKRERMTSKQVGAVIWRKTPAFWKLDNIHTHSPKRATCCLFSPTRDWPMA